MWQRRLAAQVDAFVVPSRFALERLHEMGAPLGPRPVRVLPHVIREFASAPATAATAADAPALLATRLSAEKGVEDAIEACRRAGVPLVIAGEGPERARLQDIAGVGVTFRGQVSAGELARLRREASVAVLPSRAAETFGLAAAEAMAAGLPVAATRVGALPELVPDAWLAPPGDTAALASVITRLRGDERAGAEAIQRVRAVAAPEVVGPVLAEIYG
jgi:glycosyltransferase involved in cell wall biosynthesis